MSGVDTRFTAHSTRSAATSKASRAGLSAAQILSAANWSPGSTTFARFYLKPIQQGFSAAVLNSENAKKSHRSTRTGGGRNPHAAGVAHADAADDNELEDAESG
uniref:Uncharacterized protein n=1 Tax=Plectus sambesii TaxID=2011161 RepID=A0A914VLM9_9BILA